MSYKTCKAEELEAGKRIVSTIGDVFEVKAVEVEGVKVIVTAEPLVKGITGPHGGRFKMRKGSSVTLAEFAD